MALTRAEMEEVIRNGGSVGIGGVHITTIEGLPPESELAQGDPERLAAAESDLQAKIRDLEEELVRVKSAQGSEVQGGSEQNADPSAARFDALMAGTADELRGTASGYGLPTSGSKRDLAARICDHEFPEPEQSPAE